MIVGADYPFYARYIPVPGEEVTNSFILEEDAGKSLSGKSRKRNAVEFSLKHLDQVTIPLTKPIEFEFISPYEVWADIEGIRIRGRIRLSGEHL